MSCRRATPNLQRALRLNYEFQTIGNLKLIHPDHLVNCKKSFSQRQPYKGHSRFHSTLESDEGMPDHPKDSTKKGKDYVFNEGEGRSVEDVVGRVACLQLLLARWGIEAALQSGNSTQRIQTSYDGIERVIKLKELQNYLTTNEKKMLLQPLGRWTQVELTESEERWEEFGIFQWCLGIQKSVPSYFEEYPKGQLFTTTGMVPGQPSSFVNFISHSPALVVPRSQEEIKAQLTQAELWLWRSQAQKLLSLKEPHTNIFSDEDLDGLTSFAHLPSDVRRMIEKLPQAIAHTANLAHGRGFISAVVGEDFGVHSNVDPSIDTEDLMVAYHQLSEHALNRLSTLAHSRYHALAYVSGALQNYDDPITQLTDTSPQPNALGNLPRIWDPDT